MLNWYRVERVLGRGGFGVIYLATDTNLQLPVAIKEYRMGAAAADDDTTGWTDSYPQDPQRRRSSATDSPTTADAGSVGTHDDREGVQRFIAEARNLVRFKHPNIVRVMSVFELHDTAYMVMEYEEGVDLRTHLQSPRNRSEMALKSLVLPIIHGLMEVHRHGLVHRDIKPANILVRPDGSPVLLDFGSARHVGQQGQADMTALVSDGYSPLEQYGGNSEHQQGPWTDIHALGAVLYRAVTGVEPVNSAQRGSALINGGKDPLLPASLLGRDRYSEAFLRAIDWALAFRIDDRPQSLTDWKRALLQSDVVTAPVNTALQGGDSGAKSDARADSTASTIADEADWQDGRDSHEAPLIIDKQDWRDAQSQWRTQWRTPSRTPSSSRSVPMTASERQADVDVDSLPMSLRSYWRRSRRRWRHRMYWLLPLVLASALAMSWLGLLSRETLPYLAGLDPDSPAVTRDNADDVVAMNSATVTTTGTSDSINSAGSSESGDTDGRGGAVDEHSSDSIPGEPGLAQQAADTAAEAGADSVSDAGADGGTEADNEAVAAANSAAREREQQLAAAAEAARLTALEVSRQEQLRVRRQQLSAVLDSAEAFLDEGRLEQAESALDEAAILNRNAARLKSLRARWRAALVDARIPVSDSDFDSVIERFDRLRRAIESGDRDTMNALTERSGQNALFTQLIDNFAELEIRIDRIRVTNVDKSISARLRIERMIRENGDRATPSPAYRDRVISSQRIEGQWSAIRW